MMLYSLREQNGLWRIVQSDGNDYARYAPFFGKKQAERTVALLNQPILLERIAELELQHAAMKALLEELYHGYVDSEPNYDIEPLEPFTNWLRRVKALLGKE